MNNMKRIIAIAAAVLLALTAHAQNSREIYNRYSDEEGVSAVFISPSMFRMIGRLPDIDMDLDNGQKMNLSSVIKSLKGFYLINCERSSMTDKLNSDVKRLINSDDYELMMEAKDDGEAMRLYTVGTKDMIHSLVMHVTDRDETTFIGIDGVMDRDELEKLLSKAME